MELEAVVLTGGFLILDLAYPLSIVHGLGAKRSLRWIQNDWGVVWFSILLYPICIWLFVGRFNVAHVAAIGWLGWGLLAVLVALATWAIIDDAKRPQIAKAPIMVGPAKNGRACRLAADDLDLKIRAGAWGDGSGKRYRKKLAAIEDSDRKSPSFWVLMAINFTATYGIIVFVWYWLCVFLFEFALSQQELETNLTVFLLLCVWFLLRVYSEWYFNFQSIDHLEKYHALFILAVFAFLLWILIFVHVNGLSTKTPYMERTIYAGGIVSGITGFFGLNARGLFTSIADRGGEAVVPALSAGGPGALPRAVHLGQAASLTRGPYRPRFFSGPGDPCRRRLRISL